ncbi:MAG TPA: 3-deoxy-7-phosphoheptulonate synthase AroG [Terriglobia bacterium]|nr:3-deoxy-7-phosphoheptulonate synthase AroG [Terriglobia bacterium]
MLRRTDDLRIREIKELTPPGTVIKEFPATETSGQTTFETRQAIHRILHGEDDRLLMVVGPCSIHDPKAALEYARRLKEQKNRFAEDLLIVMRVYFEKPRTTIGWKGLINDPYLDGSFRINDGLRIGRKLLLELNEMGMPAGVEYLDVMSPQYIADLVSWGAIGARTTESQVHRELASGLSCPVGFKNGTDGNLKVAIDAVRTSREPHHFLSVTKEGHSAIVSTMGNDDCHVILRGGKKPNYDAASVAAAASEIAATRLEPRIMIDLSHSNSQKNYLKQIEVGKEVAGQIAAGDTRIMGIMIESNLQPGRQDLVEGRELVYGQSVTDACIGWEDTSPLLETFAAAVRTRRTASREHAVTVAPHS